MPKTKRTVAEHEARREAHNRRTREYHAKIRAMTVPCRHAHKLEGLREKLTILCEETTAWTKTDDEMLPETQALLDQAGELIDIAVSKLESLGADETYEAIPKQRYKRIPLTVGGYAKIIEKRREDFFDLFAPEDLDYLLICQIDDKKKTALVQASDGFQQAVRKSALRGVKRRG